MLVTLPLYILRELGKALGLSLLLYTFMMLGITAAQVIKDGVGVLTTLLLLPNMIPLVSSFVLPFSVITAILICYGKLSSGNEFVATQASGVHPGWLALPAVVMAALSSLVCLYLNADILTKSVLRIERRVFQDRADIIRSQLSRPGSFTYPLKRGRDERKSLTISRLPASWIPPGETGVATDLEPYGLDVANFIWQAKPDADRLKSRWDPEHPAPTDRYLAMRHRIEVTEDKEDNVLVMTPRLQEFIYQDTDDPNYLTFTSNRAALHYALESADVRTHIAQDRIQYWGIDKLVRERRNLTLPYEEDTEGIFLTTNRELANLLLESGEAVLAATADPEASNALATAISRVERDLSRPPHRLQPSLEELFDILSASRISLPPNTEGLLRQTQAYMRSYGNMEEQTRRITTELHTKLTYSFGCIAFACIGIPMGLIARRDSKILGFAVGFLFGGMYILTVLMLRRLVLDSQMSWHILWSPAVMIFLIGGLLWWRVMRRMR